MGSSQEFGGEIRDHLGRGTGGADPFDHPDVTVQHAVAHRAGERHVPVVACGVLRRLGLDAVQVVDQCLTDRLRIESRPYVRWRTPPVGIRGTSDRRLHTVLPWRSGSHTGTTQGRGGTRTGTAMAPPMPPRARFGYPL